MSGEQQKAATQDITERLRQEFRVRSWWPGMDAFDSARGETEPHPVALDAVEEIERLRRIVARSVDGGGEVAEYHGRAEWVWMRVMSTEHTDCFVDPDDVAAIERAQLQSGSREADRG